MQLTKHHGLANDFLVVLDAPADADLARRLCDRHRGIGADGLILGALGDGGVTMTLWNADGSRAEMSGNGIRCLAQAVADATGLGEGELRIDTDAGLKVVRVGAEVEPGLRMVTVDMGPAKGTAHEGRAEVDMGNPHTVLLVAGLHSLPYEDASRNVEFVHPGPEPDAITMRVVERGVGETQACGTGACAAAWAAHEWGITGEVVTVHQPGGDAVVELQPDAILLTGPTQLIARIELP